jgi:uncharacterized protein YndB with AHSA1/START domain
MNTTPFRNAQTNDMSTADREIVFTRLLDAPRELVFDVWTDPKHIANWWGPEGFTNTISEMDVRPGGVWRFVMRGPDGTEYPNKIVYDEIVRPEHIMYEHGADGDDDAGNFSVMATFAEQDGKTHLTMRILFKTVEECNRKKAFGAIEGGNSTMDKLEAYLAKMER